tara:strand:- start:7402 stop:7587 length:186 start_codon:yes stop_codon:yes gene_type:complete
MVRLKTLCHADGAVECVRLICLEAKRHNLMKAPRDSVWCGAEPLAQLQADAREAACWRMAA